ncbi:MAG: histidine phosphatase family protein [Pseudomonadota bacterium]
MIVIVRHGNTFESGEAPRRIGARTDLPLTARGMDQADALGDHFAQQGIAFDRVLASPLKRAKQTAQRLVAKQDRISPLEDAEFLREIDYGPDENRLEDDVLARIGAPALEAWEQRAVAPDGWIVDAGERLRAWRELLSEPGSHDQNTLLVTSNGAARFALLADANLRVQSENLSSLKLPTGGLGLLEWSDSNRWRISAWGVRP